MNIAHIFISTTTFCSAVAPLKNWVVTPTALNSFCLTKCETMMWPSWCSEQTDLRLKWAYCISRRPSICVHRQFICSEEMEELIRDYLFIQGRKASCNKNKRLSFSKKVGSMISTIVSMYLLYLTSRNIIASSRTTNNLLCFGILLRPYTNDTDWQPVNKNWLIS